MYIAIYYHRTRYRVYCYIGGTFGTQPANEYCFTLSNTNVISSVGFDLKYVAMF